MRFDINRAGDFIRLSFLDVPFVRANVFHLVGRECTTKNASTDFSFLGRD